MLDTRDRLHRYEPILFAREIVNECSTSRNSSKEKRHFILLLLRGSIKNGKQSLLKTFLSIHNSVHDEQLKKNEKRKATQIDMFMYTRVLFIEVTRSHREREKRREVSDYIGYATKGEIFWLR